MTFRMNYQSMGRLLVSPQMQEAMRKKAERVKDRAVDLAPDAAPYGEGYIDNFEVDSGIRAGKTKRAFGRVRNTDRKAALIEFGTGETVGRNGRKHGATPKFRVLGRALDAEVPKS